MDHTKQLEEAFRYVDQHFDDMLEKYRPPAPSAA